MSRADHELANVVLRDALLEACDVIAGLAKDDPSKVADALERMRMLAERTRAEDNEDDPPFSEHAREAAWRAWQYAFASSSSSPTVREEMALFKEWWFSDTQLRMRGVLKPGPEQKTRSQQVAEFERERWRYEDDD